MSKKQDKINGQKLKDFRLNVLKMGTHTFAKWLGIKPSHICNIERGRKFDESFDEKSLKKSGLL